MTIDTPSLSDPVAQAWDDTPLPNHATPEMVSLRRAGLARRPVPFALRLLDRLLTVSGVSEIATTTEAQIVAGQKPLPRNSLTNLLFGKPLGNKDVEFECLKVDGSDLSLRVYRPKQPRAGRVGLLYFHGGGWVGGDAGLSDWWCSHYAARTQTVVASLDYRLAPVHRFPAALQDCYQALRWFSDQHEVLGIDPGCIGVAGDSAGGNLAAALCIYAGEHQGPPIAYQILINPALDLTFSSDSVSENTSAPLLSELALRAYARHYIGRNQLPAHPHASPLLAEDLSHLPPALIQVGEHDPLRDDGWRYAMRLEAQGVPVQVTEYAGAPHGFVNFPNLTRIAQRALGEAILYGASFAPSAAGHTNLSETGT